MIPDSKNSLLYLADSLPVKQPKFFKGFKKVLNESAIEYKLIPGTKDIWSRDYMPVQVGKMNLYNSLIIQLICMI